MQDWSLVTIDLQVVVNTYFILLMDFEFWKLKGIPKAKGGPKIDENEENDWVEFLDKHITCASSDETKYPEMSNVVKKVQTHDHATTCRKK